MDHIQISEQERDIIKEIVNIGLAKAADSFAMLSRDKVMLSVPDVRIVDPDEIDTLLLRHTRSDTLILSDVRGDLNGKTFLLFTENQSNKLAEVCMGPAQNFSGNYAALKRSLLLETSNILTAAIVTQLANLFKLHLYGSPPMIVNSSFNKKLHEIIEDFPAFKPFVLTVNTLFINRETHVELPLLIVFDITSMEKVLMIIRTQTAANKRWLVAV